MKPATATKTTKAAPAKTPAAAVKEKKVYLVKTRSKDRNGEYYYVKLDAKTKKLFESNSCSLAEFETNKNLGLYVSNRNDTKVVSIREKTAHSVINRTLSSLLLGYVSGTYIKHINGDFLDFTFDNMKRHNMLDNLAN